MCGGEKSSEQKSLQALISAFPEERRFFVVWVPGVSPQTRKETPT
jgi:hypothetical protein